ncbi:radical SAM/SPASM domain-containing protein [Austwickia chelonae]|uniref:radical SAM/SPASM domain-containing protein n=1 Tax=Austwickia chelonae TaxID=100225 RepID=UPI0013C30B50|nr:radical SAM protein [Austwickia chelonae]
MPIRSLTLWPTAACDLDCLYCYRGIRRGVMSEETALAAVELAAASGDPFHIQFAGGEPLLRPELIDLVCRHVAENGLPARVDVQTNATRIDPETVRLLRRHRIGVGVSVDGPPDVQESLRGRARQTFAGLDLLAEHSVPVRVTTVVTSANVLRLGETALMLAGYPNIRGLALDLLTPLGAASLRPDLTASESELVCGLRSLHSVVTRLTRMRCAPFVWRELETVRRSLRLASENAVPVRISSRPERGSPSSRPLASVGAYCHASLGESVAVAPDGTVYPCSQAVGDPKRAAGTIHDVDWPCLRSQFRATPLRGPCHRCPLDGRCPGDCPSRMESTRKPGSSESADLACVLHRTLAESERTRS